jgi:glycosyltransferase involved in cell wall biosynthesis
MELAKLEISVVMPCLNEEKTISSCVEQALLSLSKMNMQSEVVVADNGSVDNSVKLALKAGASVVHVAKKGYGNAILGGLAVARGRFVVMADSDASYDFSMIPIFFEMLQEGNQLVIGNRFKGKIMPNAMPRLHRYFGNPLLSWIGGLLFQLKGFDFHCGIRAFDRHSILGLSLCSPGMEFASEMIAKASMRKIRIVEIPVTLFPDGRGHRSHLRSWRDGLRHLILMVRLRFDF